MITLILWIIGLMITTQIALYTMKHADHPWATIAAVYGLVSSLVTIVLSVCVIVIMVARIVIAYL